MTLRKATPDDAAALERFLAQHPDTSMFLRGNMEEQGVGISDHPHSADYWIWGGRGAIRAVFGLTAKGYVMVQCPGREPEAMAAFARAVAGRRMLGLTGEAGQAAALLEALGVAGQMHLNRAEPLYAMALADLPAGAEEIRAPQASDGDLLEDWFLHYQVDTGMMPGPVPEALAEAKERREGVIAGRPLCRLMIEGGRPVAMAAINSRVADMVQVGGVFVPRDLRGRGLARRVTAALLREEAAKGASRAVLFAASETAARAYEAIGFLRIGDYLMAMAPGPVTIPGGVAA